MPNYDIYEKFMQYEIVSSLEIIISNYKNKEIIDKATNICKNYLSNEP